MRMSDWSSDLCSSDLRDDAPLPYDVQEVVFADDVLPILHEIEQQVEDLGPYRDPVGAACEFPSFRVERIVLEGVVHFDPPGSLTQASGTQPRQERRRPQIQPTI